MKKICVHLDKRSYNILITFNEVQKLGRIIRQLYIGNDAIIITNPVVQRLFGHRIEKSLKSSGFNVRFEIVPDTEKAKSDKYCIKLLNSISRFDNSHRRLFLIALGGGVIGDLVGFVASIYRRGIPYIQIPTTLLAQVDSAIGGKVAIDLKVGKNLAGNFYQPRLVFSDISLIKTLPKKDLISGLAEVIKYGIIRSPELFKFLERNYEKILTCDKEALQYIIYTCSKIKTGIIESDEYDNKNIRVILNLGHTIGHAIETSSHYGKSYTHGQAIGIGILSSSLISNKMGILDTKDYLKIKNLIEKVGLPTTIKNLKVGDIYSAQEHDKKFIYGKNRFVLPVQIGKAVVKENIPELLIKGALYDLKKR